MLRVANALALVGLLCLLALLSTIDFLGRNIDGKPTISRIELSSKPQPLTPLPWVPLTPPPATTPERPNEAGKEEKPRKPRPPFRPEKPKPLGHRAKAAITPRLPTATPDMLIAADCREEPHPYELEKLVSLGDRANTSKTLKNEKPNVSIRRLSSRKAALNRTASPPFESLPTGVYDLLASEVVVGVFHCIKNERTKLQAIAETWGRTLTDPSISRPGDLKVVLLASQPAVKRAPSRFVYPIESMVVTSEPKDHYQSTLGKGLLGLKGMYETFPQAKWFAVTGDDVSVDPASLRRYLSAFDPDEEWCLVETSTAPNMRHLTGGSAWRISGGAPIITSRALTKRLVPHLEKFNREADPSVVHDSQFTRLMDLHVSLARD